MQNIQYSCKSITPPINKAGQNQFVYFLYSRIHNNLRSNEKIIHLRTKHSNSIKAVEYVALTVNNNYKLGMGQLPWHVGIESISEKIPS